ncbi:MAG: exodeoxyribonuclease VII small subunit [Actinobacteria bacterium]|jgi:exodeoxyribonuclease VII small subunit|nr:exodeoxyribonuclease VII small subunit [Actinomycetota bacterium]
MASSQSKDSAQESLSYEQAREELVQIVATLEAGTSTLEQSLQLWERGEVLAKVCQDWLDGARERLAAAADSESAPAGQSAQD